jgi:hypothetical protein
MPKSLHLLSITRIKTSFIFHLFQVFSLKRYYFSNVWYCLKWDFSRKQSIWKRAKSLLFVVTNKERMYLEVDLEDEDVTFHLK